MFITSEFWENREENYKIKRKIKKEKQIRLAKKAERKRMERYDLHNINVEKIKKTQKCRNKLSFTQRWAIKNIIYFKRKPLKGIGLFQFLFRWVGKV